jgi:molybdate transport system ATP-binding protein
VLEVRVKKKIPEFILDVAFSVNQEILAILGPSGSGKTMTLHCIAGLINPDEGYIKLNDRVLFDSTAGINLPPQVRKVGFVFQNYALFHHLTVEQNIAYGIRHLPQKEVNEKVSQLLEKMNIKRLGHRYPRQLSAGQQQRVAVARALAPEPEVLLLDEPFSALDSLVKERLQLELQSLQRFYKGNMLFVTHDLIEGYKLSSKIAVYETGHIIQCDEKEKVIASPSNHTVAKLTGYKNLLEGTVVEIKDSNAWVKVPELGGNIKALIKNALNLAINQHVTIGIRPEYIGLMNRTGENTFLCTLDRIAEGVATTNYYFHVNSVTSSGHYIMAIISKSGESPIHEGEECYLYLPPEHVVVII